MRRYVQSSAAAVRYYELKISTPVGPLPGVVCTNADSVVLQLKVVTSVGPIEAAFEVRPEGS